MDPHNRTMTMRSRNMTHANLLLVEEVCHYEEDKATSASSSTPFLTGATRFLQEARFVACGVNISSVARKVEEVCVSNFAKNADRGREGLQNVINRIVSETREFADRVSKTSARELLA